ncbi:HAD family hydrolase [Rhodocyclus tenuis]|uniref:HAD-IB family hydrolase n=3 Tax=Rhodocyclus TaxID=1064 RepID=A0A6L5JYJ7_RHOTE|nr:HAD-IB family hydrolase [Rhodocyclus gracilis]MRD73214.1 HAD-IB family hydrolase [Rhodocyclus gracilis]NJA89005.1 HAD family hydrolase [Rhodocyclus gracilis]
MTDFPHLPAADGRELALFDLDHTLLAGDSDFEWAQFLIGRGVLDSDLHSRMNHEFYRQYVDGTLDIYEFLEFQLAPLMRHPREQLDAWHAEFMQTRILPIIGEKARALVRRHLERGDLCAIVTATNSFVTGPIARELGIPHLIATIPAQDDGQFIGRPRGRPSFREGKVIRVEDWLEALGLWRGSFRRSWFYSDSHNDLPLLNWVTSPVAVDPDARLSEAATAAGWPILSLRG